MRDYAIVWTDTLEPPREVWVGTLGIASDGARLLGSNGRDVRLLDLAGSEIAAVGRAGHGERLAGYRSLRLELRTGGVFLIASVLGLGMMTELLDRLAALVPPT